MLDEDPCQTQEELASALRVTRQAISKRLHALGMIQKQGTWVPYDLKPRLSVIFPPVNNCFSGKKRKGYLHRIVYNIVSITTTQREESHGNCPIIILRRRLGQIFTLRRLCCIWCDQVRVIYYEPLKPNELSLGNSIERDWCVWAEDCAKNGHNTSRGTKKWFCSMTALGLTLPNPLKHIWKRSNGKSYLTRRIP